MGTKDQGQTAAPKAVEKTLTLKELKADLEKFGASDDTVLTKVRVDFRAKGVKLRYDHPAPKGE
jgi:hypothetical protein